MLPQLLYLAAGVGFLRRVTPSTRDSFDSTCAGASATGKQRKGSRKTAEWLMRKKKDAQI